MMRWVSAALSIDSTLEKKEVTRRRQFLWISLATLVVLVVFLVSTHSSVSFMFIFHVCSTLFPLAGIVVILLQRKLSFAFIIGSCVGYFVVTVISDINARTVGHTWYPALILILDVLLVMQVPSQYTAGFVVAACLWITLVALETGFRFGLLDIPGFTTQKERWSHHARLGSCAELPCVDEDAFSRWVVALGVFMVDFITTRGFAAEVLKEQASMERTINAVQEIASLLAGYDVEQVAELLEVHAGELPPEMADALRALEENLRGYKAYLPKTCLPFEGSDVVESECSSDYSVEVDSPRERDIPKFPSFCAPTTLSSVRATLLTLNMKDTLLRLDESTLFAQHFSTILLKTLQAADTRRGMVDVFIGDRIHCSFNASKRCLDHATSALHMASILMGDKEDVVSQVNIGVATGKVLRGDMGCEVMRRFSMVGELVRDVGVMERAGRILGCDVLCNRLCFSDAECEHNLRMVPCRVEVAPGCDPEIVAEMLIRTDLPDNTANVGDEWMYQIGGKKDWDDYNQAARKFLRGEVSLKHLSTLAPDKARTLDISAVPLQEGVLCPVEAIGAMHRVSCRMRAENVDNL